MDNNSTIITKSPEETASAGAEVASALKEKGSGKHARVVCLYGDLGSGKTTFVQGFARTMGIASRLLSPTFIIVRRYTIPSSEFFLYHIDLYRIQTVADIENIGLREIVADPKAYVCIEWAERLGNLLPQRRSDIRLRVLDDGQHEIVITENF
jgi:tRNA threonylcarbamoyladenosine biosynthesis protein TsaE